MAAGGDVLVQQGGTLTIGSGILNIGTVTGGAGGNGNSGQNGAAGGAFGGSLFLQGNQTITLSPPTGQNVIIRGDIADQTGSGGAPAPMPVRAALW